MPPVDCPACGGTHELHVNLDFQLGAGDGDFKAVSAHLPETLEWLGEEEEGRKKESKVLSVAVVLEARGEGTQFCWMPSGHVAIILGSRV